MERLEQIILATLQLATKNGLGNVSLQMIADEVGIRKASLFNHIKSKDDLIEKMYEYLRNSSKKSIENWNIDYSQSLEDILLACYYNYLHMCKDSNLNMFYRIIYSERAFNHNATQIVLAETEKMVLATKRLFHRLEQEGKMKNLNNDVDAVEFAFTIHSFIDYEIDCGNLSLEPSIRVVDYIKAFSERYQ